MHVLQILVVVAIAMVLGRLLSRWLPIPEPLILLVLGFALGFVPNFGDFEVPPDMILLIFLPALLYWESLTISIQGMIRSIGGIFLSATVLVVISALGVGGIGTLGGFSFATAFLIGAALAPTDATAVASLMGSMPRTKVTRLKAESLVNDGTSLVILAVAIGVAVEQKTYTGWSIAGIAVLSYLGGIIAGGIIAGIVRLLMRLHDDVMTRNLILIVTPFVAFLLAELVNASGVIAVVTSGLIIGRVGAKDTDALSRRQSAFFWDIATTLINSFLYLLTGMGIRSAVADTTIPHFTRLLFVVIGVFAGSIAIRWVFFTLVAAINRAFNSTLRAHIPAGRAYKTQVVYAVAGLRGAISLAAAYSIPLIMGDGSTFQDRDEVVFVVAGVVVLSLFLQGALLPVVVKWANFPADHSNQMELRNAQLAAARSVEKKIPELAATYGISERLKDSAMSNAAAEIEFLECSGEAAQGRDGDQGTDGDAGQSADQDGDLAHISDRAVNFELALLAEKRKVFQRMRAEGEIDDDILRRLTAALDMQEARFAFHEE